MSNTMRTEANFSFWIPQGLAQNFQLPIFPPNNILINDQTFLRAGIQIV